MLHLEPFSRVLPPTKWLVLALGHMWLCLIVRSQDGQFWDERGFLDEFQQPELPCQGTNVFFPTDRFKNLDMRHY